MSYQSSIIQALMSVGAAAKFAVDKADKKEGMKAATENRTNLSTSEQVADNQKLLQETRAQRRAMESLLLKRAQKSIQESGRKAAIESLRKARISGEISGRVERKAVNVLGSTKNPG